MSTGVCAVVDGTGAIVNVILADPAADQPPDGYTLVSAEGIPLDAGWTWDGAQFVAPPPPPDPPVT